MDADGRQRHVAIRVGVLVNIAIDLRLKRFLLFKGRASRSRPEGIGHTLDVAYLVVPVHDRQGRHWRDMVRYRWLCRGAPGHN